MLFFSPAFVQSSIDREQLGNVTSDPISYFSSIERLEDYVLSRIFKNFVLINLRFRHTHP